MSRTASSARDGGLKSEALRNALTAALAGQPAALEDFFSRYGGGPDPRPNLKLAAAFGEEMAAHEGPAARLLSRLSAEDAAPDTAQVFLPMAAAFGWVGRLRAGQDVDLAWATLAELAADERAPVRLGTHAALHAFALVGDGAVELLARARAWLELEDREVRFGAASLVLEVMGDRQVLAAIKDLDGALDYVAGAITDAADAPRSAERSEGRRRLLAALPRTLAMVVSLGGEVGLSWLEEECRRAKNPDVRKSLSDSVLRVQGQNAGLAQRVRQALEGSAKPPRDPTRKRPGAGRGKVWRRTR